VLITEGVTSIHEAVRHGAGVAVLPEWIVGPDLVSGRLVRVLPGWNARPLPVRVIHPNDRHLAMRVRVFRDFALAHLRGDLGGEGLPGVEAA
jgi:DNA-binding transcriptional LysR family regulator